MRNEDENRSRIFLIRLKPKEFKILDDGLKRTGFRSMSEYSRSLLLEKPITFYYRDKAMDDVQGELIRIRKELNVAGNNFNQVVRKLNSVSGMPDAHLWEASLTILRDELQPVIEEIKERLNTYSEIWSQKLSAGKV